MSGVDRPRTATLTPAGMPPPAYRVVRSRPRAGGRSGVATSLKLRSFRPRCGRRSKCRTSAPRRCRPPRRVGRASDRGSLRSCSFSVMNPGHVRAPRASALPEGREHRARQPLPLGSVLGGAAGIAALRGRLLTILHGEHCVLDVGDGGKHGRSPCFAEAVCPVDERTMPPLNHHVKTRPGIA